MHRAKQKGRGKSTSGHMMSVGIVCAHASEREALVIGLGLVSRQVQAIDCGAGMADSVVRVRDLAIEVVLVGLESGPAASFGTALRSAAPGVRVVVLLRSEAEGVLRRLAGAGVVGFVPPGAGLAACVRALRAVHSHGFHCPPEFAAEVFGASKLPTEDGRSVHRGSATLRGRPLQIAECVAEGLTNKEIAARLRIAEGTVKSHVHAVLLALGVEHRWEVQGVLPATPPRLHVVRK